jgi:hypothetical protein
VPKRTPLIISLLSVWFFFAPSGQFAALAVDRIIMATPSHDFFEFPVIDVAYVGKAEEEGLRRLIYLGDIIELPLTGIGVSDSKLTKGRDQVRKVIRAALRGTRFMKQNRTETVQMMTESLGITLPQAGRA